MSTLAAHTWVYRQPPALTEALAYVAYLIGVGWLVLRRPTPAQGATVRA